MDRSLIVGAKLSDIRPQFLGPFLALTMTLEGEEHSVEKVGEAGHREENMPLLRLGECVEVHVIRPALI